LGDFQYVRRPGRFDPIRPFTPRRHRWSAGVAKGV
jgi:hypothetical protein